MPSLPRPASRTLREFLFQITTIIAGILIALWVDGIVEARREAALVRDAHAALRREIAENLQSLNESLPALEKHEQQLLNGQQLAEDLLRRRKTDITEFPLQLEMPILRRASWQAAERSGALGYMDFGDTKTYAEIYDVQDFVVASQRQQVAHVADVTARFIAGPGRDPFRMTPQELEAFRGRVLDALGAVRIHRTLVTSLVKAYETAPRTSH